MDDLMKCLYEFLMERRMGRLWEDSEYKACVLNTELQEQRVTSSLNEEQQKELSRFLDRLAERDNIEKTRLFQATLELVQELNALVRA